MYVSTQLNNTSPLNRWFKKSLLGLVVDLFFRLALSIRKSSNFSVVSLEDTSRRGPQLHGFSKANPWRSFLSLKLPHIQLVWKGFPVLHVLSPFWWRSAKKSHLLLTVLFQMPPRSLHSFDSYTPQQYVHESHPLIGYNFLLVLLLWYRLE